MFKRLVAAFFLLLALPAMASRLVVMTDPMVVNVPNGVGAEQVKKVVLDALSKHGWAWTEDGQDQLVATVSPRDVSAKIRVAYNTNTITITYLDSTNMLYRVVDGVREIHQNYNRWMNYLDADMQNELADQATSAAAPSSAASTAAVPPPAASSSAASWKPAGSPQTAAPQASPSH